MKRILFVIPFLSSGGAERVVSIWTSELAKLGGDIHLLVFYRVDNEYSIDERVKLHTIARDKSKYKKMSYIQKLLYLRWKLKEINPDFVLPFITYVGLLISVARIGLPLKVIETIRIDPRYSPQKRLVRWIRNISVIFSKRCIVQNDTQKEYFPKWLQRRIEVFPNPIANEFIKSGKVFTNRKIKNIVAVGRLEKQKNFPMLISAFTKIVKGNEQIKLRIYGEGSLYGVLSNHINEINMRDRIMLCGRTNNMCQVLQESDMFILSSDAEGMPNSLMEAMATGLPCISTDCPTGPADLIEDGINGYLIPVGDEEALIDSMNNMITNVDNAIKMGQKARETIISRYTARISARNLLNFIESI